MTTGLTDEEVEQLQERLDPKPSSSSAVAKKRGSSVPTAAVGDVGSTVTTSSQSSSMSVTATQHQPYLSVSCSFVMCMCTLTVCMISCDYCELTNQINSMEGYLTKLGFHRKVLTSTVHTHALIPV